MMNPNLGTAVLRTRLEQSGLRTGLSQAEREVKAFTSRAGRDFEQLGRRLRGVGTALTVGVTTPLVALSAGFIKAASDAEETASKFATVFRDVGDEAERSADRLSESFGLSSTNARRLLGDTGDLLTGFGFTGEAALDLSTQVNELAVDLASFTNFQGGAEGASAALTKALLGETEAAKSLGIAIRQDLVTAKIEELEASGELVDATETQARAYATLAIAQEQSANAIGDYARTSESFANQTRRLRSGINDLAVELGEVLLPIATAAVSSLTGFVDTIADLPDAAQVAIVAFGGIAAAAGPLLLALGQIVTVAPKVVAGLRAIRTATLLAAGPAGWAAAGAIAVGGLALAFAGRRDSLEDAVGKAGTALAGSDASSAVSALERVKDRVDVSAVPAVQRLIDKIAEAGEVSADTRAEFDRLVGSFDRIAAEAELASVNAQIATLEAEGVGGLSRAGQGLAGSQELLDRALLQAGYGPGDLTFTIDDQGRVTLEALTDALRDDQGRARVPADDVVQSVVFDTIARSREALDSGLADLLERRAELEAQLASPTAPPPGETRPPPGRTGPGFTPPDVEERTVRTVFDELAARGAALVRIADFEGTPEAAIESAEDRVRLIDDAIRELLTDFVDTVGEDELEYLRTRRAELEQGIRIATRDPSLAPGLLQGGGLPGTLPATPDGTPPTSRPSFEAEARAAAAALERALNPLVAAQLQAQQGGGRRYTDEEIAAANASAVAANERAAADARAREETDRLVTSFARLETITSDPLVAARLSAQQGGGREPTQAEVDAYNATVEAANERAAADERAREETERLIDTFARVNRIETDPLLRARLSAQQGGPRPTSSPGEDLAEDVGEAGDTLSDDLIDAGARLKLDLADAAAGFTVGILQAVQSGDFVSAISQTFQAASSVTGALANFGPAAGLLSAGTAGTLGIISAALPIIGGLFSGIAGLFGGGRDRAEEERQAAESRRANRTPSFVVRVSVSQTNNYDSTNVDPQVRADNDRRTRAIVADVLRQIDYAGLRRAALGSPL
jgi:hypothetical protein